MIVPAAVEDVQGHMASAIAAKIELPLTASCMRKGQQQPYTKFADHLCQLQQRLIGSVRGT